MDRKSEPDTSIMQAMIFGAVSSPFCAQYIKKLNAEKYIDKWPRAYQAVRYNHYVDDYLDSTDTEEEAIELIKQVQEINESGSFELCQWISNSQIIKESIPENLRTNVKKFSGDKNSDTQIEKVWGMYWNPNDDILQFSTNFQRIEENLINGSRLPTKRELLKIIMSLYDPLGLIAHYSIQEVWRSACKWNDLIDENIGKNEENG